MSLVMMANQDVHVDDEGFLTEYDEWNEQLAQQLAANIGIELEDRHMEAIRFLRKDFKSEGETATLRRVATPLRRSGGETPLLRGPSRGEHT